MTAPSPKREKWIGILQPVYLPWLGYFEQMARVDHFVFLDDAQYTKQDWRNRNQVKTASGPAWLTAPVHHAPLGTLINAVQINYSRDWIKKHVRTIRQAYARAPHVDRVVEQLEARLERRPALLADLTIDLAGWIASELGIRASLTRSRDILRSADADRNGRLVEIVNACGATHLYLGARAKAYAVSEAYEPYGITLAFQDYRHPEYPQQHGPFAPYMSAIDLLMNVAPEEAGRIMRSGAA